MHRRYLVLALSAIVAFGSLSVLLFSARFGYYSDIMMAVFFAGSVGAVVNNYFRLSKIAPAEIALQKELEHPSIVIQLLVSPLLSGILGFVAYSLFSSGLIQGELFPKFVHLDGDYIGLTDLLAKVAPKTNLDATKAIFWAFVAGFSERLIPNVLDSLVLKAEQVGKS